MQVLGGDGPVCILPQWMRDHLVRWDVSPSATTSDGPPSPRVEIANLIDCGMDCPTYAFRRPALGDEILRSHA